MTVQKIGRTFWIPLGISWLLPLAGAQAQEPQEPTATPSPAATPLPSQETPSGVPSGYDDAILLPPGATPSPTPVSTPSDLDRIGMPPDHDEFFAESKPMQEEWDPKKPFPGNYYGLPLTLDVGWRPCLDCSGNVYQRPGDVTLWAGYAFQPWARVSSPYMAMGVEAIVANVEHGGSTWRGRSQWTPTLRAGWNFSAASVYTVAGVIVPGEERDRAGYHVGVGASSFAFLALAACTAEAIPSVIEIGADFHPDARGGRTRGEWTLKVGWGF